MGSTDEGSEFKAPSGGGGGAGGGIAALAALGFRGGIEGSFDKARNNAGDIRASDVTPNT
jgi:hypothetical protein